MADDAEAELVLELAAAVYRLDRGNVVVPDPLNPAVSTLVDGQRSEGFELSAAGNLTSAWSIVGAYAFQDGEILQSLSSTARAGAASVCGAGEIHSRSDTRCGNRNLHDHPERA